MFNMYLNIERKISFGGYELFWGTLYLFKTIICSSAKMKKSHNIPLTLVFLTFAKLSDTFCTNCRKDDNDKMWEFL